MSQSTTLIYSCHHQSTCHPNDFSNNENDPESAPQQQQKFLPMQCYCCVQARFSAQSFTMSGTGTDSTEGFKTQVKAWAEKYDEKAEILCRANESVVRGVRDFGLEEAAYSAARGVVGLVEGLDEIGDEERVKEYEVEKDGEGDELEKEGRDVREVNGRLIIPGNGTLRPMRVVRERRSAPVVGRKEEEETVEDDFRRQLIGSRRGGEGKEGEVDGKEDERKDIEDNIEVMPQGAFKRSFFGGLRGLRDGAIARLGFRKDERKAAQLDVETDEERPITPKKR